MRVLHVSTLSRHRGDGQAAGAAPGATIKPYAGAELFVLVAVPELNQLLLPFLSLVTDSELRRNPTVRDEIAHSRQASVSGLMLTYPAHQAADILAVKGNLVLVGKDQLPHVEVARLTVRRFTALRPARVRIATIACS